MSADSVSPRPGRGMVITGAIFLAIGFIITIACSIYFITGVASSPEAMSMVFPFLLVAWVTFGAPPWYLGLILGGIGRTRQRGPVKAAPLAWILGAAVFVFVPVGLMLVASTGSGPLFVVFVIAIPLLILAGFGGAAWLMWGTPRDQAVTSAS